MAKYNPGKHICKKKQNFFVYKYHSRENIVIDLMAILFFVIRDVHELMLRGDNKSEMGLLL